MNRPQSGVLLYTNSFIKFTDSVAGQPERDAEATWLSLGI